MRRGALVAVALMLACGLMASATHDARAADSTFGTPSASATFGQSITFVQPVSLSGDLKRAEILLTFAGSDEAYVRDVSLASNPRPSTLQFSWSISVDGYTLPNTKVSARWRITYADASPGSATGPAVSVLYADTRFDWHTLDGTLVRLHWFSGSQAFGERALKIGEEAVQKASALFGVTETDPIDFFVYDDQSFCPALGLGQTCNVGGRAIVDNRTMFGRIGPSEVNSTEVARVVTHELTHLVFNTATKNQYHAPADWLNEGLAVYLSEGNADYLRTAVAQAEQAGTLKPLDAYAMTFAPQELYDQFILAYGESVSAVDFLVKTYGQPAMVKLVRSYAAGLTDDEAFTAALGVDVAAFQTAWLASIGAKAPTQYGPQPAPPGPVPSGWNVTGEAVASALPSVAPSSGALASGSPQAVASPGGNAAPVTPPDTGTGGGLDPAVVIILAAVAGLAVGGVVAWVMRRRAGRSSVG